MGRNDIDAYNREKSSLFIQQTYTLSYFYLESLNIKFQIVIIIIMKPNIKNNEHLHSSRSRGSNNVLNHLSLPLANSINIIMEKTENQSEQQLHQSRSQMQSNVSMNNRKVSYNNISASEQVNLSIKTEDFMENKNLLQQFALAWKTQTSFSIILVEKLIKIVKDYFKMLDQIVQRNSQMEILIIYNKSLLDIMNKFQDQEKRLIHKLRTMEQFNIKIMKEYCALKKKQFYTPQVKTEQPIFSKFSLTNLKYESPIKHQIEIPQQYKDKLQKMFKTHLLHKNSEYIPIIQSKIKQLELTQVEHHNIIKKTKLSDLKELLNDVIRYNEQINEITSQNMFDLYNLKQKIKQQIQDNKICEESYSEKQNLNERQFVRHVISINSKLTKMDESQIISYLKQERQKRKKIRNLRVKQQQLFVRNCEKTEAENIDLKQTISSQKQKITSLQQQVSRYKAQLDFKNMKQKANKSSNMSMDESIMQGDMKLTRKLMKETNKTLQQDLKKVKQDNQILRKKLEELEDLMKISSQKKKDIIKKAKLKNILLTEDMNEQAVFEILVTNYSKLQQQYEIIQKSKKQFLT